MSSSPPAPLTNGEGLTASPVLRRSAPVALEKVALNLLGDVGRDEPDIPSNAIESAGKRGARSFEGEPEEWFARLMISQKPLCCKVKHAAHQSLSLFLSRLLPLSKPPTELRLTMNALPCLPLLVQLVSAYSPP